jgi:hypothetical protein
MDPQQTYINSNINRYSYIIHHLYQIHSKKNRYSWKPNKSFRVCYYLKPSKSFRPPVSESSETLKATVILNHGNCSRKLIKGFRAHKRLNQPNAYCTVGSTSEIFQDLFRHRKEPVQDVLVCRLRNVPTDEPK